jgi:hypothetical protein
MRATRLLSLSIAVAAASLLAHAQSFTKVEVNLPAVSAGATQLPAGNYEIRPVATAPGTFGLYKDGVFCESMVHATPIAKSDADVQTSVVLRVDGNHYQLSQLWIDGANGYQFTMPAVSRNSETRSLAIKASHN